MKYRYYILCCVILFSSNLFAATHHYQPLRFQVNGINNDVVQKNVNLTLRNFRSALHFPLTQEEKLRFARKAPSFIQTAVEPYGYFRSRVQTTLSKVSRNFLVTFNVTLGPALPIKSVQVNIKGQGSKDHKFKQFLTHLPFHVGGPLQTETYDNAKLKLYNIATERGYFQAKMIKSQIRINLKKYDAKIIIIFDTGPRYRFGPTTFSKTPFYETFLQKFLTYQEGHYYNAKKLEHTQENFVSSNYFNQVTPEVSPKKATHYSVPIHFKLMPRKAKAYIMGLGYGSDTGIRGTLGLRLRQIGHKGHRFQTLLRASPKDSSLTAKYIIPGPNPARDHFTIGSGVSNMSQSTGQARNAKFGVNYTLLAKHWKNSLSLTYLNERYNIVHLPRTQTQLVYPAYDIKYINADHPKHPIKGISMEMRLAGTNKKFLSQTSFFQMQLHLKTLYTIEKTKTRLLFRSDYGYTNIANLFHLPLSLQLFAGGSRSVRGYGYNSIGPGRNLVVASSEVQQRIAGSVYLTAFVDAGVVADHNIFHHVNVGTGPGLAYVSSLGTMELTFADAFTQSNKPWSVQFTMGTAL